MKKQLSRDETDQALNKIRAEYMRYIEDYDKPMVHINEFDNRYRAALQKKMALESFILAEMNFIIGKISEAETERQQELENQRRYRAYQQRNSGGYVNNMYEKMAKRMQQYPALELPTGAATDVTHLFGAIRQYYDEYWRQNSPLLQEEGGRYIDIERQLHMLITLNDNQPPLSLARYATLLNGRSSKKELVHTAQQCIKEGAFWLHELRLLIKNLLRKEPDKQESEPLCHGYQFINRVIDDFRLRDIKPRRSLRL